MGPCEIGPHNQGTMKIQTDAIKLHIGLGCVRVFVFVFWKKYLKNNFLMGLVRPHQSLMRLSCWAWGAYKRRSQTGPATVEDFLWFSLYFCTFVFVCLSTLVDIYAFVPTLQTALTNGLRDSRRWPLCFVFFLYLCVFVLVYRYMYLHMVLTDRHSDSQRWTRGYITSCIVSGFAENLIKKENAKDVKIKTNIIECWLSFQGYTLQCWNYHNTEHRKLKQFTIKV